MLSQSLGYTVAKLLGLQETDRRAIAMETGIQNSGLDLILVFNFFDGLGGIAIVAAIWGTWHIVSGLIVATIWSRKAPAFTTESSIPPLTVTKNT